MTDMTPTPISVERLRELHRSLARLKASRVIVQHADDLLAVEDGIDALLHQLAERDVEVERLRRECDLRKHAVDRWVPCPDHRDKTDGRCYVCAKEAAERAREEAEIMLSVFTTLGAQVTRTSCGRYRINREPETDRGTARESIAAFLAASGGA